MRSFLCVAVTVALFGCSTTVSPRVSDAAPDLPTDTDVPGDAGFDVPAIDTFDAGFVVPDAPAPLDLPVLVDDPPVDVAPDLPAEVDVPRTPGAPCTMGVGPCRTTGHLAAAFRPFRIAVGGASLCLLGVDGTVRCQGSAEDGQLGNGTTAPSPARTTDEHPTLAGAIHVAGYGATYCAIMEDATVRCWGRNDRRQAGDPSAPYVATPHRIAGLDGVVDLSLGATQTCALRRDGTVWCWGAGGLDPLPSREPQRPDHAAPERVPRLTRVVRVGVGESHACAIRDDQSLWCWGANANGQLGNGSTLPTPYPQRVLLHGFSDLALGARHTCASSGGGAVACWGDNRDGQLGLPGRAAVNAPTYQPAVFGLGTLAAGERHTCVVRDVRRVSCWGDNGDGQLGDGTTTAREGTVAVVGLNDAMVLTGGPYTTCSVDTDTVTFRCWGRRAHGQLGTELAPASTPVVVAPLDGALHCDAPRGTGIAEYCDAEDNDCNGVADDSLRNRCAVCGPARSCTVGVGRCARPGEVVCGQRPVRAFNVDTTSCVVTASGVTRCVGPMLTGLAGAASSTVHFTTLGLPDVVEVTAAGFVCARRASGRLTCWGPNAEGYLGLGDTRDRLSPDPTSTTLTQVAQATMGARSACAARTDGTVWCWGANDAGQLGDGTRTDRLAPVRVVGLTNAVEVRAGENVACARRTDGSVWCWGLHGQLGSGTNTLSAVPLQVRITDVRSIVRGVRHTCALRVDGSVWCWGDNNVGQLGDGTFIPTDLHGDVPVRALLTGPQVQIAAGSHSTCARDAGGRVTCWGASGSGQLGFASTASREPTPRAVPDLDDATDLRASMAGACVLRRRGGLWCWGNAFLGGYNERSAPHALREITGYEENDETCQGTPGDPVAETCNGMDDDCDGVVDNLASGAACP